MLPQKLYKLATIGRGTNYIKSQNSNIISIIIVVDSVNIMINSSALTYIGDGFCQLHHLILGRLQQWLFQLQGLNTHNTDNNNT